MSNVAQRSQGDLHVRPRRRLTEAKLLAAGLQELARSPQSELTIRGVAARAEISPANAYKYFSSKNALVAAIYLDLLARLPPRTGIEESAKKRVVATMRDMATLVADLPELATACAAALVANDPAVAPYRTRIAAEVSGRITAALGPGWVESVSETLQLAFFGALMAARFEQFDDVSAPLEAAVHLVLGSAIE